MIQLSGASPAARAEPAGCARDQPVGTEMAAWASDLGVQGGLLSGTGCDMSARMRVDAPSGRRQSGTIRCGGRGTCGVGRIQGKVTAFRRG